MFELKFETTNAAFEGAFARTSEVVCILETAASRLREGYVAGTISDSNGNTIGSWGLAEDYSTVYQQALDAEEAGETAIAGKLYERADDLQALDADVEPRGGYTPEQRERLGLI